MFQRFTTRIPQWRQTLQHSLSPFKIPTITNNNNNIYTNQYRTTKSSYTHQKPLTTQSFGAIFGLSMAYQLITPQSTLNTTFNNDQNNSNSLNQSFLSITSPSVSFFDTVHASGRTKTKRVRPRVPEKALTNDYDIYGGLSPMEFRPFRCSDISVISEDTCFYCFNLATANAKLNLPVSSYVLARSEINGETVIRPYTPIANFTGELPLLVKTYPNSKMGGKFASLEVGDTIYFKGPFQTFVYEPNAFDRVTLVAGGTGVTPMMQMVDKILTNPLDRTKIHLILANKDEYNMPLALELNEFAETYPNRLRVTHVIEQPKQPKKWDGLTGHISKELLMVSCGKPHPHHKVFVAGSPGFMKYICGTKGEDYTQGVVTGLMAELGYTERDVFKF